jgi:hypothetical protein
MSSLAVFLVIGGATAFAASHLAKKSVGTKQLKSNAVTTAKIKNNAVTLKKIKDGAVTESKIGPGAVTNAKLATGAVTAAKIANGAVGAGQLGANAAGNAQTQLVKVFKAGAVPAAADEASAPKIELGSVGPFNFYGKCFKTGANVQEKTYIELTGGIATVGSEDAVELPTPAVQEYLTTATPEATRFLQDDSIAAADKVSAVSNDEEFQASATDGTEITGLAGGTAAKQGNPPIGDGPLLPGNSCIIGTVAVFGN